MSAESPLKAQTTAEDSPDLIIIRDPEVDVDALMQQVRANVAQRRAAGGYQEDLDAIAEDVRAQVLGAQALTLGVDQQSQFPLLTELDRHWLVREPEFRSKAPVIGPLIVGVRRAWNWMSTKWYVRDILNQQIGFNALVVQALNEVYQAHRALEAEVTELQTLCEEQQAELAILRERVTGQKRDRADDRGTEL